MIVAQHQRGTVKWKLRVKELVWDEITFLMGWESAMRNTSAQYFAAEKRTDTGATNERETTRDECL